MIIEVTMEINPNSIKVLEISAAPIAIKRVRKKIFNTHIPANIPVTYIKKPGKPNFLLVFQQ